MPPMRSGTPALKACESQPNPILVSMISVPVFEPVGLAGALAQKELGQLQIPRLGNLQINLRTVYDGYRKSRALDNRGFIGAHKAVRGGFVHRFLQKPIPEPLGRLRQHDELARNGGGNKCTMRGAFYLLDGVYSGQSDDR